MYHSESGQDRWLEENVFKGRLDGTFFEAGALDGILHSNTLFFEQERGWKGLLVEPNPTLALMVPDNRPFAQFQSVGLWSSSDSKVFEEITGGLFGWSGLITSRTLEDDERVKQTIPPIARQCHYIEVRTLDSVLSSAGLTKIDYLCLDIEGAELEVLSVFPFHKYDIDVLSVEDNTECNRVLAELIAQNGFEHLTRIGPDEIWRKVR